MGRHLLQHTLLKGLKSNAIEEGLGVREGEHTHLGDWMCENKIIK